MRIRYAFDTSDYADAYKVVGDTDTKLALIIVSEDGGFSAVELEPLELRALSVALLEVADRLDPPQPSLATQLNEALRTGLPPIGTTGF